MPSHEFIGYEMTGGIGTATLRRPEKLNAFHDGMLRELGDVLADVAGSEEVRVDAATARVLDRLGQSLLLPTADAAEGARAFRAKRPPTFTGR